MADADWIHDYLTALPPELRTGPQDSKLLEAAGIAIRNGWPAAGIAAAVADKRYDGALYPSLIGIQRLAEIGATRPRPAGGWSGPSRANWQESHCGRTGCTCTHDQGCFKGWLDGIAGEPARACWNCRPSLARALADIPLPGGRTVADLGYLRGRMSA